MNEKQLSERIKAGSISGAYLFAGEEDYLKRHYLGELRTASVSDPVYSTFNHIVYDGQDVSFASIIKAIKAPPFFDSFKLIEWRYPSFAKMKEGDLAAFEKVLEAVKLYDYSVLAVLVADGEVELGTEKRPSKFEKRFKDKIEIFNFERRSEKPLMAWLKRHFDKEGIIVSAEALSALIFRSGRSMDVLSNEVIKLSAYLKANGRDILTTTDVKEVASSTPECDTFALTNALLDRNKKAAYLALDEMKRERQDTTMIVGMMAKTYSELLTVVSMCSDGMNSTAIESATGLHPYKVKSYLGASRNFKPGAPRAILDELSRVDIGLKCGGVSGYCAIEMFISKCV